MALSKEKQQQIHETRKRQILEAAGKLFDKKGYSNTKISDIAEEAHISKGLVYRYFNSKEAVLFSLNDNLKHCISECQALPSAREAMRLFGMRLLSYPYYEGYVPPFRIFFTAMIRDNIQLDGLDFPITDDFGKEYFGELFKRGQEQGEFRDGNPQEFGDIYWKYLLGCLSVMSPDKQGKTYTPDIDTILDLFAISN